MQPMRFLQSCPKAVRGLAVGLATLAFSAFLLTGLLELWSSATQTAGSSYIRSLEPTDGDMR